MGIQPGLDGPWRDRVHRPGAALRRVSRATRVRHGSAWLDEAERVVNAAASLREQNLCKECVEHQNEHGRAHHSARRRASDALRAMAGVESDVTRND